MTIQEPQLLAYEDYRTFFREYISFKNETKKGYSIAQLAKKLELPYSSLKMILTHKRNLSQEKVIHIVKALKFSEDEEAYLRSLISLETNLKCDQRKYHINKLQNLRKKKSCDILHYINQDLFQKWFFPPLILYVIDILQSKQLIFDDQLYSHLQKKFPINKEDFQTLQTILQDPEIAKIGSDQKIVLSIEKLGISVDQEKYLKSVCQLNMNNLRSNYNRTTAISISEENLEEFKKDYRDLLRKYVAKDLDHSGKNTVAQITWHINKF